MTNPRETVGMETRAMGPAQEGEKRPGVSIILPTYNRAKFLPQAFESIKAQRFTDWELIVVDDGSTDNTRELVAELARGLAQPVRYFYQENQGAYGARNTGLDHAEGEYVAFYDSDDVWLLHHLQDSTSALAANPEVDWAYGSCRIVDLSSGRVLAPSTFYVGERPRPFLNLKTQQAGNFRIFQDAGTLKCLLAYGLYCGLQNSLIRRRAFEGRRFDVRHRNEAEDVLAATRIMAAGHRFGYFDNVHVVYRIHDQNSSAAGTSGSLEKRLEVHRAILLGFEDMMAEVRLSPEEMHVLRWSLGQTYFWKVGYALLWQHGRHKEAFEMFRSGLRLRPWNLSYWKTYLLCRLKAAVTGRR
jgi:cellulose synthase/poly-beta-1,6-N-acetylglucosamine synthase-like glycosyltransferase